MSLLTDFLRMKSPKSGKDMPAYYMNALTATAVLLIVYFLASFVLFGVSCGSWQAAPLILAAATGVVLPNIKRMGPRFSGLVEAAIVGGWCLWSVHNFGWSVSIQQLLVAPLMLSFFNVYEKPLTKILFCMAIAAFRMLLFVHATHHAEVLVLNEGARITFQCFNTVSLYTLLAVLCVLFSTNLQAGERQLRIANQALHREAGTDPLTQLPNRRAMMDAIHTALKKAPDQAFSVAIADIDFFKKINDTYGHNCGDYTLKALANKFREFCGDRINVCRWGGEEFCFFMPGMNLDEAAAAMNDLCNAVRRIPLSFEDTDFIITITIGVSENDFKSPIDAILEEADRKLYMGKESGRDKVVA